MKAAKSKIIQTSGWIYLNQTYGNDRPEGYPKKAAVDRAWKELMRAEPAPRPPPPTPPTVTNAPAAATIATAAATITTTAPSPLSDATAPTHPSDSVCEGYSFDSEGARWVVYEPGEPGDCREDDEWWVVPEAEAHRCLEHFIDQEHPSRTNILEHEISAAPFTGHIRTGRIEPGLCDCDMCS